jgi:hypothetical protein
MARVYDRICSDATLLRLVLALAHLLSCMVVKMAVEGTSEARAPGIALISDIP